jgi:hypothetical protein
VLIGVVQRSLEHWSVDNPLQYGAPVQRRKTLNRTRVGFLRIGYRALLNAVELMGPGRSPKLAQATIAATTITTSRRAAVRVPRGFITAD